MPARSGRQDRRGFETFIRLQFLVVAAGFGLLLFYSWKVGLAVLMTGCACFILLETASGPPINNPEIFSIWVRRQPGRKPVLLCLGDSLTHGVCSADFTPEIPFKLSETLGLPLPKGGKEFTDPVWVINAGQNGITTYTVLYERLNKALSCHPDYVLVMIGTNDMRGVYSSTWGRRTKALNDLPAVPTMESFERNLKGILDFLHKASPLVQIGVCTLPPMGENLKHKANQVIRNANEIIERVVSQAQGKVTLVPIYANMEAVLEKKGKRSMSLPVDYFFPVSAFLFPIYHFLPIFSWNTLSSWVGNIILLDGLHLNERGRDIVVDAVVEWLVKANVAKAIAVKSAS